MQRLVRRRTFTAVISTVIAANGIYIGVETDATNPDAFVWGAFEFIFTSIFLIELMIRLYAERFRFFLDGWNNFDFGLVSIAVFDTYFLQYLAKADNAQYNVLSLLRILRLARLARIFRLLRFFKELWLLVSGVLDAMRTLVWAWMLVLLLIYIFGIFITRLVGIPHRDGDEDIMRYFGSVTKSMFTLFQVMTTEGWADVARSAMAKAGWAWIFFILFLSTTTFAIMNVVVAVIVENTLDQALHQKDDLMKRAEVEKQAACGKIYEVFRTADSDGNGELTKEEFMEALNRKDVMRYLHEVGIDVRQAENLFDILDYDESGNLDAQEFLEGVMKARGEAKAKDVLSVQCDMWRSEQKMRKEVTDFVDSVSSRTESLDSQLDVMKEGLEAMKRALSITSQVS